MYWIAQILEKSKVDDQAILINQICCFIENRSNLFFSPTVIFRVKEKNQDCQ